MRNELKNILLGCGILLLVGIGIIFYQTIMQVLPTLQNNKNIKAEVVEIKNINNLSASAYREDLVILVGTSTLLKLEVATSSESREQGLSNRLSLPADQGLLFIFPDPKFYGFWMKEMNFAIDIIWLDEDGVVVDITKEALPETYPEVFYPPTPIKYVIEVNAGYAEERGLELGDAFSPLP